MKKIFAFIFLMAFTAPLFAAQEISSANFESVIKSNKNVLVMVYRHGCHWCDKTLPVLEQFEKANPQILVAQLDVVKETGLRELLKINTGTPTFLKFSDGVERGRWTGYSDLNGLTARFQNPPPTEQKQAIYPGEILANLFYQNQRLDRMEKRLAITQIMVFLLVVVSFFIGRAIK